MTKPLKNVSASQIKTYHSCKRKWHWEKIAGHRSPPTEKMAKGTAIHHAIECFIEGTEVEGTVPVLKYNGRVLKDPEKIKKARENDETWEFKTDMYVEEAKNYLPHNAIAEQRFSLPTLDGEGPPMFGYVDVHTPTLVLDWKTTSSLRWAKTPSELKRDPQALIYAKWHWEKYNILNEVKFVYIETAAKTKTRSMETAIKLSYDEINNFWNELQPTVASMVEDAKVINTLDLAPSPSACNDYGGCPHKARCGLTGLQGLYKTNRKGKSKMAKNIQDLIKKKAETPSIVPPDAPNPEVQPGEAKKLTEPKKKRTTRVKKGGPTVYVDCAPLKGLGKVTLFEEWIQPAIQAANEIAAKSELPDWRMLGYTDEKLAFQKGVELLVEDGIPDGLVVSSWHPQAKEALAVIMLYAPNVVRGLR